MSVKEYEKGGVTVVWKSDLCIHSEKCFRGLPGVFNPKERPWINMEGASVEDIVNQVGRCPSGALSIKQPERDSEEYQRVEVTPAGPLIIRGKVVVCKVDGEEEVREQVALCRCGGSSNKPFCDGTHKRNGFSD